MRQDPAQARLTEEILFLHQGIMKVYLLQEAAGRFEVVERAARRRFGDEEDEFDEGLEMGSLNPARILGDAADLGLGFPKLLGVVCGVESLVFVRIGSDRLLAVRAEAARLHEVLQSLSTALPRFVAGVGMGSMPVKEVKSVADITEIARNYVTALVRSPDVGIDKVRLDQDGRIWGVQGSYRTNPFARAKKFELQLGAQKGEVTGFATIPRPSLAPLVTGICIILGTLVFLTWFLFLNG